MRRVLILIGLIVGLLAMTGSVSAQTSTAGYYLGTLTVGTNDNFAGTVRGLQSSIGSISPDTFVSNGADLTIVQLYTATVSRNPGEFTNPPVGNLRLSIRRSNGSPTRSEDFPDTITVSNSRGTSITFGSPGALQQNIRREYSPSGSSANDVVALFATGASLTVTWGTPPPPTVTLVLTPSTISEFRLNNSSAVTATLDRASTDSITVTISIPSGSGGIATLSTRRVLTIAAGSTISTGVATITAVDDLVATGDKTLAVSGVVAGSRSIQNPSDVILTIIDNETPRVSLSIEFPIIPESGRFNNTSVTASIPSAFTSNITITISASPSSAVTLSTNRTLTITAGEITSTGTVTITAVDDGASGDKTVTISGVATGVANPVDATLTILDDETGPTVTLNLNPSTIYESSDDGATRSFVTATLSRGYPLVLGLLITINPENGARVNVGSGTGRLEFAANSTTSNGTVTIDSVDDNVPGNKSINVIGTIENGEIRNPANAILTIEDDGDPPSTPAVASLILTPSTINEAGAGNVSTVTASLDKVHTSNVSIVVSAAPSAAVTLSTNKTLTIAAGATASTGTVTITAVDDSAPGDKTVTVSGVATGLANPSDVVLTITNDDIPVSTITSALVLTPSTINESGAGNVSTVTATLGSAPSSEVTIVVSASPSAAVILSANETLTFASGSTTSTGTVTITAVDDSILGNDKTITVSGVATGASNPANATLMITNDDIDFPTATIVLTPSTINESGGGNVSRVTATLDGSYSSTVSITVSIDPSDTSTLSASTVLTIASGAVTSAGTVTLTAVDNNVIETNTVTVEGTSSVSQITVNSAILTIRDDDVPDPFATLHLSQYTIGHLGRDFGVYNIHVNAELDRIHPDSDVTLTIAVQDPETDEGRAILSTNQDLVIPMGEILSTGNVTITIDYSNDIGHQRIIIVSASISNGGILPPYSVPIAVGSLPPNSNMAASNDSRTFHESGGSNSIEIFQSGIILSGLDLVAVPSNLVTISPLLIRREARATVTAVDDEIHTGDRTVYIIGTTTPFGLDPQPRRMIILTITEDDTILPTPTIILTPNVINEQGSGDYVSTVTATLDRPPLSTQAISIIAVPDDAATISANTVLTFAEGSTTSTGLVTFINHNDNVLTGDVVVTVYSESDTINSASAQLLVVDNDSPPTASIILTPEVISEAGGTNTTTVTARLTRPSTQNISITVTTTPIDRTTFSTNRILNISSGSLNSTGTVTLTAINNLVLGDATIVVSGTVTSGSASVAGGSLTIEDDDSGSGGGGDPTQVARIILSHRTINEMGDGNITTVTASLITPSTQDISITVTTNPTNRTTFSSNRVLSIPMGARDSTGVVTLTAVDNQVAEGDATIVIGGNVTSGGITVASATLTITDDEEPTIGGGFGGGVDTERRVSNGQRYTTLKTAVTYTTSPVPGEDILTFIRLGWIPLGLPYTSWQIRGIPADAVLDPASGCAASSRNPGQHICLFGVGGLDLILPDSGRFTIQVRAEYLNASQDDLQIQDGNTLIIIGGNSRVYSAWSDPVDIYYSRVVITTPEITDAPPPPPFESGSIQQSIRNVVRDLNTEAGLGEDDDEPILVVIWIIVLGGIAVIPVAMGFGSMPANILGGMMFVGGWLSGPTLLGLPWIMALLPVAIIIICALIYLYTRMR